MLSPGRVRSIIDNLHDLMLVAGRDPKNYDNFGSVRLYLQRVPEARDLDRGELKIIEGVFAGHEVGNIPNSYALVIKKLKETHSLGIVSNIWAAKDIFEQELQNTDILDCFDVLVWSSEHGSIKPSPRLFQLALDRLHLAPEKVLFVGDDFYRDVWGAKNMGMAAVWVNNHNENILSADPQPDVIISDLYDLLSLERKQQPGR